MSCPHRPPCPGCPRYGEPEIDPASLQQLGALANEHAAPPPRSVLGPVQGYRHRVRLAVRGRTRSPKIGLFQEGSHRIVDIPRCELHHPVLNRIASEVKRAIRDTGVAPYAERPHLGTVRYIQAVVQRSDQRVQLVVVGNAREADPLSPLLDELALRLGGQLQALFFNGQPERSNSILGPHWRLWAGEPYLVEDIGGADVFFPPGAFGQANLALADRAVARIHEWVPDGTRVLEFHAGCGAIGLGLVGRVAQLTFNERSPHGLAGLERGLQARSNRNPPLAPRPETQTRTEIRRGPAGEAAGQLLSPPGPDVVIVDPPRRGLDPDLRGALAEHPPERLIYLSCGLPSFLDDARFLLAGGRLRLAELENYAFFPFTQESEVLARFERSARGPRGLSGEGPDGRAESGPGRSQK